MPNILELETAYNAAKKDPAFHAEMADFQTHYIGRPSPLYLRRASHRASRRGQDLPQARGAEPHRRAQGQQRARPDPARPAHGQEAHHRRDRRGAARRRHRDPLRALRSRLRRLHGRGRRRAAEAERLPHEDARRRSRARAVGIEDPEGRHERGVARLGHQRRGHLLLHRHGRRSASLSGDGARFPMRHRRARPARR